MLFASWVEVWLLCFLGFDLRGATVDSRLQALAGSFADGLALDGSLAWWVVAWPIGSLLSSRLSTPVHPLQD